MGAYLSTCVYFSATRSALTSEEKPPVQRTVTLKSVEADEDYAARKKDKLFGRGVLHIQVFKARNIKGDEFVGLGKADPYVVVKLGSVGNRKPLKSETHQDGASNPVWNYEFKFPLQNGGTPAHNILDIKVYNENADTKCCRTDNCIGSLRMENLAEWVMSHEHNITEPQWYPLVYKYSRGGQDQAEGKGEILVKFYFQEVDEGVFAKGFHTVPSCCLIPGRTAVGVDDDDHEYTTAGGKIQRSNTLFAVAGAALGVLDTASVFVPLLILL
ncbi:hypothetical protein R1sor_023641 [Riccia sorocarpa]|uniref:C2 domain-containing protein n=1 Tax=Riccia sorocarpa TaxID=122646 RepID=A0ABD3GN84_9MARC